MKKYFVDTNYFLRLFIGDSPEQLKTVVSFFKQAARQELEAHTSSLVFFEVYWVLSSLYQKPRETCLSYLQSMLEMSFIQVEERETLETAVVLFQTHSSINLEDAYHLSSMKLLKIPHLASFDQKLQKTLTKIV